MKNGLFILLLLPCFAAAQDSQGEYSVMQDFLQEDNAAYSGHAPSAWSDGGTSSGDAVPMSGNPAVTPSALSLLNGLNTRQQEDSESLIAAPHLPDQSALWLMNGASAHLNNPHIIKKGNTTNLEASRQGGLNAAIRAAGGSFLSMRDGHISTMGIGAAALFGAGNRTLLLIRGSSLRTWMDSSPGLAATSLSQARTSYLSISTQGTNSPAVLITGQGSRMLAYETLLLTEGPQSPAILCSAGLNMDAARLQSDMSPALVVEPEGGVTLSQAALSGTNPATVLLRSQQANGADGPPLRLSLVRCSLSGMQDEPLFLITNVQADVTLSSVKVGQAGRRLMQVSAYLWGTAGYNGGNLFLRADDSHLSGDIEVDVLSRADVILGQGTVWEGKFTDGGRTALSLERGAVWQPGGSCMVGSIDFGGREPEEGVRSILQVQGADVIYDPRVNPGLENRSFSLPNGGRLLPARTPAAQ